ncbi:unnamed protein product, partial [Owenia fusiformis]
GTNCEKVDCDAGSSTRNKFPCNAHNEKDYYYSCRCPGFRGSCYSLCHPADCKDCVDRGQCVHGKYDSQPEVCGCVCENSWSGGKCDECFKYTHRQYTCQNGGVWNPKRCACDCLKQWAEKDCSVDCSVGDPTKFPCNRHSEATFDYSCRNQWILKKCRPTCYPKCMNYHKTKDCPNLSEPLVCENGGTFDQTSCKCLCKTGYAGKNCEKDEQSTTAKPTTSAKP